MQLLNDQVVEQQVFNNGLALFIIHYLLGLLQRFLTQLFLGLDAAHVVDGLLREQCNQLITNQRLVVLHGLLGFGPCNPQSDIGFVDVQLRSAIKP